MKRRTVAVFVLNALQVMLVLAVFVVHTEAAQASQAAATRWEWPLPGDSVVDKPFQPPTTAWGAGHRGVDLRGYVGESVLSAGAGRISYAGLLAGRGVVTVTHDNGLRTTYEPVEATVAVGQSVLAGDVLGTLGTGHDSCRPGTACLHWGLLRGETYLDPLSLVTDGRVRLLPLGDAHSLAVGAAVVGRPDPVLPLPEAVVHPRRRALWLVENQAFNLTGVLLVGFSLYRGGRRGWRLIRRAR